MNNAYSKQSQKFHDIELQDKVNSASPHELVNLLYQGAKQKIQCVIMAIQHNKQDEKGIHITKAIAIISGLKDGISNKTKGEVSETLSNIYDYLLMTLLDANIENNIEKLQNCYQHIDTISDAWNRIKPELAAVRN